MQAPTGLRVEVRLDQEHRDKLARIVEARGGTVSDIVRGAIEKGEREIALAEWEALVDHLQRTATWTPSDEEINELLDDPQCPELDESPR